MTFHKSTVEFHTRWAQVWQANRVAFQEAADSFQYHNGRPSVYAAQREFERHLNGIMNYGSHQPLY